MRRYIQDKLITEHTFKLTVIIVGCLLLTTTLMTAGLSILVLGYASMQFILANLLIGTVVPALIAPLAINLFKQVNSVERANLELASENLEIKQLERETDQRARNMQAVNELAIECAAAAPDTDIYRLIAEKLRDITGALGVGVTVYDPALRILTTKYVAISGQILAIANQLIGFNLVGMVNHVTPEMEAHMLEGTVDSFSDLSDVSFGAVPKPISTVIKNTVGVGAFVGLALTYGGKLVGTAIIAQREGQPALDTELYKALAHVSAVSIQRKNAEDALRESEVKFRTLIENLSEGILLLDEQGNIIEWNPAQAFIADMPREQVIGKPIWDIQFQLTPEGQRTADLYEAIKQNVKKVLVSGEFSHLNQTIRGTLQSDKGATKQILQTSFSIRTQHGYRIGSVMHDVSNQVRAEEDREKLIAELKAKNTELEQFTYTVSHDLKAPIITIKGFLGLLEKDALGGNIELLKKDIHRITSASDKMQSLLNELLELSRIGRIVNPSREIPFEKIVQDALATVHGRLEAHKVKVHVMPVLPVVFVDQTRVNQVVQNLLDNAAKFMGEQSDPTIEIGTKGMDKDGKPIFYVRDNGIGIAPEHLDTVFGLFQKLDPYADGTGIGLVLVKRIIEIHGGRIWIDSAGLGKGTTVYFTLPVP